MIVIVFSSLYIIFTARLFQYLERFANQKLFYEFFALESGNLSCQLIVVVIMDEKSVSRENLAKNIAGSIVLSEGPGAEINKWRTIFKIHQYTLAEKMGVMSSVISDYESGRRKSPGAVMVKKIVNALLAADEERGSFISHEFNKIYAGQKLNDAIIDTRDLTTPRTISHIVASLNGALIAEKEHEEKNICGYTIIDSIKAIVDLSPHEFVNLCHLAQNRALVFTGVQSGKSPLVAIKAANIKPGVVIFHGMKEMDKLAEKIARVENIPVIISGATSIDELVGNLKML